nr:hypothetical protein [Lachnospiraceae bacterium]
MKDGFKRIFSEIKRTSSIVEFDEETDQIPRFAREGLNPNPLDRHVVWVIPLSEQEDKWLFCSPKAGKGVVLDTRYPTDKYLSEVFGHRLNDRSYSELNSGVATKRFIFGTIMGEYLVYRLFEVSLRCEPFLVDMYDCLLSEPYELCRYVFYESGIYIENRDGTVELTTPDRIKEKESYDATDDIDGVLEHDMMKKFRSDVRIANKEKLERILPCILSGYGSKFSFVRFLSVFSGVSERSYISGDVPERIKNDLYRRKLTPGTTVKIDKDLVAVTSARGNYYLAEPDEIRTYYDGDQVYFFRKIAYTGEWTQEFPDGSIFRYSSLFDRRIDRDIFDNTCMEEYAEHSVDKNIRSGEKINYGSAMAQMFYLSAEQAAKTEDGLFEA